MNPNPDRWWDQANCKGVDVETFYPPGGPVSRRVIAKYCEPCPVREACLQDALTIDEIDHGIRGGTTPGDRMKIRNKHQKRRQRILSCAWCHREFRTGLANAKYCPQHQTGSVRSMAYTRRVRGEVAA